MAAKPQTKLKTLYKALNLEDLNKQSCPEALITQIKGYSAKILCKSASKTLKDADDIHSQGDEELAYMQYMRSLEMFKAIKGSSEYQKDKKFYDDMIGPAKVKMALSRCEDLWTSLKNRYDQRAEIERLDSEMKEKELTDASAENEKRQQLAEKPGKNGIIVQKLKQEVVVCEGGISVLQFKNYLDQKAKSFLVVDCRFASDFASSHLNHPNCISIPKEKLTAGSSAQMIQDELSKSPEYITTSIVWSKRVQFELIILYDWNSSFESRVPAEAISILYDAITKWDPHTKYSNKPLILQGGIRNLFYSYPQLLTNPVGVQEDISSKRVDHSKAIASISYPSLDDDSGNHIIKMENGESPTKENSTLLQIREGLKQAELLEKLNEEKLKEKERCEYVAKLREDRKQKEELDKGLNEVKSSLLNGDMIVNGSVCSNNNLNNHVPGKGDGVEYNFPDSEDESLGGASFPPVLRKTSTSPNLPSVSTTAVTRPTAPKPNLSSSSKPSIGGPPNESAPIPITKVRLRDDEAPRNSLLKRSHSNPNFAQSLPDDMDITPLVEPKPIIPGINRSQKPQGPVVRRREFNTIASSDFHIQSDLSRTGLKNLGNTCYMNSIMQCLNHTQHLVDYLLKQVKTKDGRCGRNLLRGEIAEEIGAAIAEMNVGHRSIALNDLKVVISQRRPMFRPQEQQDSHEFLTVILQSMHEEAVDKSLGQKDKLPNLEDMREEDAAELHWQHYMRTEGTKISQLFGGQYRSTVECAACQYCSVTFETFFILTVPMPNATKKCTINECINLSSVEEEVPDFKCQSCKKQGRAYKKLDVWRLPPYLIIHLQRFYNDGYWKKRMGDVEFPVDTLEITSKLRAGRYDEGRSQISRYSLYGVSNHYGTMEGGHYTAYCRRTCWTKYNDQDVSIIGARDVSTAAAYILFYKNRDCTNLLDN